MLLNLEIYIKRRVLYKKLLQEHKRSLAAWDEVIATTPYPEEIPWAKKHRAEVSIKLEKVERRFEDLTLLEECLKPLLNFGDTEQGSC